LAKYEKKFHEVIRKQIGELEKLIVEKANEIQNAIRFYIGEEKSKI
jgi:hypothetical protein